VNLSYFYSGQIYLLAGPEIGLAYFIDASTYRGSTVIVGAVNILDAENSHSKNARYLIKSDYNRAPNSDIQAPLRLFPDARILAG
jgi:hypothetical protein